MGAPASKLARPHCKTCLRKTRELCIPYPLKGMACSPKRLSSGTITGTTYLGAWEHHKASLSHLTGSPIFCRIPELLILPLSLTNSSQMVKWSISKFTILWNTIKFESLTFSWRLIQSSFRHDIQWTMLFANNLRKFCLFEVKIPKYLFFSSTIEE